MEIWRTKKERHQKVLLLIHLRGHFRTSPSFYSKNSPTNSPQGQTTQYSSKQQKTKHKTSGTDETKVEMFVYDTQQNVWRKGLRAAVSTVEEE